MSAQTGLERLQPSRDDLKAFSAAFGTSASAPLFHMRAHTPEAARAAEALAAAHGGGHEVIELDEAALAAAHATLDSGASEEVQLFALGSPALTRTRTAHRTRTPPVHHSTTSVSPTPNRTP